MINLKKIFTAVFLLSGFIISQDVKQNGTSGFVFLEIPISARSAALGESSISLSDLNSDAALINPAVLGFSNQTHSFSASFSPWIADIKHYASSYAFNNDFGSVAVSLNFLDYGRMTKTVKEPGQKVFAEVGTFSANAVALGLSYSKRLTDKFSFGVSAKYVNEKIDIYNADNFLFDGGIIYNTGLSSLRIAAVLQNFGPDSKYRNDAFKMPTQLKLGASAELLGNYQSDYRLTGIVEMVHPSDSDEKINTGMEISYKNIITLRGGYKFFYDEETYSAGLGFNPRINIPINFDFAFSDYGRLGNILRFTIAVGIQ